MRETTLPHGLLRAGERRRDVCLRAPTGADEALLVEAFGGASVAERANALLARCVTRILDALIGAYDEREDTAS